MKAPSPEAPIGIFDSGMGGLSVWRAVAQTLPGEPIHYVADRAHVPYGSRDPKDILSYCEAISEHLLQQEIGRARV